MKRMKIFLLILAVASASCVEVFAGDKKLKSRGAASNLPGVPNYTLSNINRIAAWYADHGMQETWQQVFAGDGGLRFPRFTASAIYSAGLLWGGKFRDEITPILRVNGQTYNPGTRRGRILGIRTGTAEDPNAPDVRIWRIRRDYATADLRWDAAEFFQIDTSLVTLAHIDSIRNQYARDWQEWPWEKGAPFYDTNQDGRRDSTEDPGLAGADQVVWYVCNDIGVAQPWACPTSGIEEQATIWAYSRPGPLGNVIFKRFRLFYKGIASTPDTASIDSMYMCQWSDPDVGYFADDFAACDSATGLGYSYNADATDTIYQQYGLPPAAAGYRFLQGPMVRTGNPSDTAIFNFRKIPGARNLPLTAFIYLAAGGTYSDPPFSYNGAIQWYQVLRGLPPQPQGPPDPPRIINPVTGQPTSFWVSGDPVAGTGWRDGMLEPPGDRRVIMPSGPFTLAVGDSQEIIVATVVGLGTNYLNSITALRSNAQEAKRFLDSLSGTITDVKIPQSTLPHSFALLQNYPNPFNPRTIIQFTIPNLQFTSLRVYNLLGQEVATVVNEVKAPGTYEVEWDASGLGSGVYFYRLRVGQFIETKKLVLLR